MIENNGFAETYNRLNKCLYYAHKVLNDIFTNASWFLNYIEANPEAVSANIVLNVFAEDVVEFSHMNKLYMDTFTEILEDIKHPGLKSRIGSYAEIYKCFTKYVECIPKFLSLAKSGEELKGALRSVIAPTAEFESYMHKVSADMNGIMVCVSNKKDIPEKVNPFDADPCEELMNSLVLHGLMIQSDENNPTLSVSASSDR